MIEIENNFPNRFPKTQCVCGEKETADHIYSCEYPNENKLDKLGQRQSQTSFSSAF